MTSYFAKRKANSTAFKYGKFSGIDGSHPFKKVADGAFIEYPVRGRSGGKVVYFNFTLAKAMGLISKDHPEAMNPALEATLLDTFALQIINEYDQKNNRSFADTKPGKYMATRYLQLQHYCKRGTTSGDGRSIWNGFCEHRGRVWDITSCGTGATSLSPASANNNVHYESGDPSISYGCGYSMVSEGIIDILLSQILNQNQIATEEILCVIEFEKDYGITVRAGENLIRPSHFFNHLKQNQYDLLKSVVDYYIARQVNNGRWQVPKGKSNYRYFVEEMIKTFARITAQFEAFYIFCWLEWDGDNILADGGIIDFGSVRQFGLFYGSYKFDDDERWSTTIREQRQKARYMAQTFIQIYDFLKHKSRKPLKEFAKDKLLKVFDREFEQAKQEFLLWKLGFKPIEIQQLLRFNRKSIEALVESYDYLERQESSGELIQVPDGVCRIPLTNMRLLLAELPTLLQEGQIQGKAILPLFLSQGGDEELLLSRSRVCESIEHFLQSCHHLVARVAEAKGISTVRQLNQMKRRTVVINSQYRATGDGVCLLTEELMKLRKKLSFEDFNEVIQALTLSQQFDPDHAKSPREQKLSRSQRKALERMQKIIWDHRESL